mmetsp:Transcript_27131/g.63412  ORF Transcript_27131/g.63412 Transcript_27131/m.63412 type:complete len:196 (+) Transcript_27131:279-866(+)
MAFEKQGSFKDDAPPPQPIKKRKSGAELQPHVEYLMQGWLDKHSKKGWQKRYFTLPDHPSLLYFRGEAMERVEAEIDLKLVSLVKSEGRIVTLKLMLNKRGDMKQQPYKLRAKDKEEAQQWCKAIRDLQMHSERNLRVAEEPTPAAPTAHAPVAPSTKTKERPAVPPPPPMETERTSTIEDESGCGDWTVITHWC